MESINAHLRTIEEEFTADLNEKMARWRAAFDRDVKRLGAPVANGKLTRKLRDELTHHFIVLGITFAALYGLRLLAIHRKEMNKQAMALAAATATMIGSHTRDLVHADNVDAAFSPSRAQAIGVTETTRGFSAMGEFLMRSMGLEHRFDLWWTAEDEKVCKTCGTLHNAPRRVWSRQYPDGTPAHPVCRCRIKYWNLRNNP